MKTIKCKCGELILLDDDKFNLVALDNWSDNGTSISRLINLGSGKKLCVVMANEIMGNPSTGFIWDHKDKNRHNMLVENLRLASKSQNAANSKKYSNNTNGFIGVVFVIKSANWRYQIACNGKRYTKNGFSTAREAAQARDDKAIELFGEFANLNFPTKNRGL